MHQWITANFQLLKALHIVALVCWFAALLYLPRLFVYHAAVEDQLSNARFKQMEGKLYRGIATPAMIATVLLGGLLVLFNPYYYLISGWFHAKLTMVLLLVIYHLLCWRYLRQFRGDRCSRSPLFFRWYNEAPVVLLIGIVMMVVLRPF